MSVGHPATLHIARGAARVEYWVMRSLRRWTPQPLVEALLSRGIILKPSGDTIAPRELTGHYARRALGMEKPVTGADVVVIGYGGSFGVGMQLLDLGAGTVVLQDPYAPVRTGRYGLQGSDTNQRCQQALSAGRMSIVTDHLDVHAARKPRSADIVVSKSVLEHVADLGRLAEAIREILRDDGVSTHSVDIRDHYRRYPFEMLCYSERTWRRYLNASNNLNRLRLPDYRSIFSAHFRSVTIEPFHWLPDEFQAVKDRIRPEFLTGDDEIDCIGQFWLDLR